MKLETKGRLEKILQDDMARGVPVATALKEMERAVEELKREILVSNSSRPVCAPPHVWCREAH
ncbi:MAG: hypothetical protein QY311_01560 [Candidatus Paceibacterota bacterium]|nr:MAG: hypothetical protein QY311_01560 [Candidatus Paceibacterota bacterium]